MKILDVPQSGSLAGQTSSRNRYGQYRRTRAIPVNPASTEQGVVRARLSLASAAWRSLTDEQRAGWTSLGMLMTRTDSLGQSYSLTGLQAYIAVNSNNAAAGNAQVDTAPVYVTPEAIATITLTFSTSAFTVAYTPTPLGTGERLFVYASPLRNAGRSFESDYRLIQVGAAAGASPLDVETAYWARFGAPLVGHRVNVAVSRYVGGFVSPPIYGSAVAAA